MKHHFSALCIILFWICSSEACDSVRITNFSSETPSFIFSSKANSLELILTTNGKIILTGELGLALPSAVGEPTQNCIDGNSDYDHCFEWGDFASLLVKSRNASNGNCATIEWYSAYARRLEDCFDLVEGVHWYGGAETKIQRWPIDSVAREEAAYVTGDFIQAVQFGGVLETYWLTSSGVALHVDEATPLFTSWNTTHKNQFCLVSEDQQPYAERKDIRLKYDLCVPKPGENFKDVHIRSLRKYYTLPEQIPDERMLVYPLWSTWAQYHAEINQSLVLEMAKRIVEEGYAENSHLEIDDNWESCYGDAEFNLKKFPDPAGMVKDLHKLGFERVTLWIHPFINIGNDEYNCSSYKHAYEKKYFVKNTRNKQEVTSWWQGSDAGLIDFDNHLAIAWWRHRLEKLRTDYGITSFKFDAGEAFWLPPSVKFDNSDSYLLPNLLSTKYAEAISVFGGLVEARVGHRSQNQSIFVRMLDKDSRWGSDNGLRSLIPSLLLFSILGYSFVLPDMIGGNAYGSEVPSNDLYIRWAQANTFMPAWQFSVLPWDKDPFKVRDHVVKAAVDLRISYASKFVEAARQTIKDGSPMVRPMWWVDPDDPETFTIDDQYMLGDDVLVAPVVTEGANERDIYLPTGVWMSTSNGEKTYEGPCWLKNWPAPITVLPYFIRQSNNI